MDDISDILKDLPGWELHGSRPALVKVFKFKDFNEAFSWMTKIALYAEKINHHPEWFNVYKTVDVTLATHDVGGVSELDIKMAKAMDLMA